MLRIMTAGESHGKALVGIIEGLPANIPLNLEAINQDLARRQQGYGRGGRMTIERDQLEVISGVRGGKTLGGPISFLIHNRDYENWQEHMDPFQENLTTRAVTAPRPGHGDLTGALKYGFGDVRNVLERASARETAVRVGAGSIIKQFLKHFGIESLSHVIALGNVKARPFPVTPEAREVIDTSPVKCLDPEATIKMMAAIDEAKAQGDSLGGIFEIYITGVPVGLGSYVHWDRKIDGLLAQSLMSIQAIKGVEFGDGFSNALRSGSQVHDEIFYDPSRGYYRKTNRAGGIEGGMTNGEPIVIHCAMKPIPTLYQPLKTVDIHTKEPLEASVERSDTCALPAAALVGEMVALGVIASEMIRKYGGDTLEEMIDRWKG